MGVVFSGCTSSFSPVQMYGLRIGCYVLLTLERVLWPLQISGAAGLGFITLWL